MDFTAEFAERLRSGEITVTVRRWARPRARAGGRYRRPHLRVTIAVDSVVEVDPGAIDDTVARAAGFPNADALRARLDARGSPDGRTFEVRFHVEPLGPEPADSEIDPREMRRRLDAMDSRSTSGPWTRAVLASIEANPGVRAADLAELHGQDLQPFKARVRRLKALGLTESLEVGYRITSAGRRMLGG